MSKDTRHIPLIIVDTRNKKEIVLEQQIQPVEPIRIGAERKMAETVVQDELNWSTLFNLILKKFIIAMKAFTLLTKFYWEKLSKGALKNVRFPWLKISLLLLVCFVLLKKDMSFNFAMKAPLAALFYPEENNDSNLAHAAVFKGENLNAPVSASDLNTQRTLKFIERFTPVAKDHMNKYGVPASIKMAQALIESRAGTSQLASNHNNHFGMKCFSKKCSKGHCANLTDDHHKDFFRKFDTSIDSWKEHSKLISSGRYAHLKKYKNDYKKWAYGLKAAGYATDKKYAEKLISVIERYRLDRLDE